MKFEKDTRGIKRYIGFDIHKEYALAGGQNAQQEWVMAPRRIGMEKLREWAEANLRKGDAVVLETTTNVWDIYDIVSPLATHTVVAHAGAVRQIAEARVKTDKEDVKRLIRLLIADIVPEVWIPPTEVRELRGMISYRNRLVKTSAMIRNRLQSLLHRHNILLPKGKLLDAAWWQEQKMSTLEKMQIQQELALLEELTAHKTAVDAELGRQCLAEVGSDLHQFADAKHFCSWLGLAPHNEITGGKVMSSHRLKNRNRAGQALIHAAASNIRSHSHFGAFYRRLKGRLGEAQALIATAHKIARVIYVMLKEKQPYRAMSEREYESPRRNWEPFLKTQC